MHWWETEEGLLAGKDLLSGGTWAGVSNNGRFAMLTNFRDPKYFGREAPTRGTLVLDGVLKKSFKIEEPKDDQWNAFNGFNLLWGDAHGVHVYSNVDHHLHSLKTGIHGLSNAFLDTPWPKVECLKSWLQNRMDSSLGDPISFIHEAFDALDDEHKYPLNELPETGVGEEMELALSALKVNMDGYGSRLSTVYLRHSSGAWYVGERSIQDGVRRVFHFREVT
jgi:uncharacterized protein with NRDE domain